MKNIFLIFFPFILVSTFCEAVTIAELTETPAITDIKISPTGDYLAARVFRDNKHSLIFLDRSAVKIVGGLNLVGSNEVGRFFWANDERIVAEVYRVPTNKEAPSYWGELVAVNYDGSYSELIFGYRSGEKQTGSHIPKKDQDYEWAELIDELPNNKRKILISTTEWSSSQGKKPRAKLLDIYSGIEGNSIAFSRYGRGKFYTDHLGKIRLITSFTNDNVLHVETYPNEDIGWLDLPDTAYGKYFTPISITEDFQYAYVLDNINDDKIDLHKLSLDGKEYSKVYIHNRVDITDINLSTEGKEVYAVRVDNGYPSYLMLSGSHEEAVIFKQLLQALAGNLVEIRSRSDDGKFWIVKTGTDVDEGSFYLFDRDKNTLALLFKSRPTINSDELFTTKPIEFQSFDNTKIAGYFTKANAKDNKVAPTVVLVHGGPRVRDYWGYDSEVQVLATHGYSVLQINYRGSSGYGRKFLEAGNRQWGDNIQKDIIRGTKWAISENLAQEGKICIMGSSFGAYSAVQSAILAPELYACVVANAGIYDLNLMYTDGDIENLYGGEAFLEEAIGRDKEQLDLFSPINHVSALKAPVFIAHGKQDDRAPFKHAQELKKAMDKHKKSYEWFVKPNEAHGFYNNKNQVEYLELVLEFLEKNLG